MARRAAVARNIVLFIQSSFCLLCLQAACTCLLLPRSTLSVQNRNAKVFIILMIFNKSVVNAPGPLPGARKRGQKDSNLRAFYRLWFSRPAHSSALPCPLALRVVGLYDLWKFPSCRCRQVGGEDDEEVAGARQRAHPSGGGFTRAGRPRRSAGRGSRRG